MGKRYVVRLSGPEREQANRLSKNPTTPERVRVWASVLMAADEGLRDLQIAAQLATSVATVQRTRRRYVEFGFIAAVGGGDWLPRHSVVDPERAWIMRILSRALAITGALGAILVDYERGVCVGQEGDGRANLEVVALENMEVVRAKFATLNILKLNDVIEDIVITQASQYHLIRVLAGDHKVFLNIILDRRNGNLGLARHQMEAIERSLVEKS
jgi:Homeodomain-like domain